VGTTEIEQIDANIIREKWMNPVFVDFVFWYSIRVSNNRKYIISRLLQENVSIFQCVTYSDIAWAVTCYVNNKDYWDTMMKTNGGGGGGGENYSEEYEVGSGQKDWCRGQESREEFGRR